MKYFNYQSTPCRCRDCWTRKTLKRHPDNYIYIPTCSCGSRNWYVDNYRIEVERERSSRERCDCIGYQFPHRKTGGWCVHNPELDLSDKQKYDEFVRQG